MANKKSGLHDINEPIGEEAVETTNPLDAALQRVEQASVARGNANGTIATNGIVPKTTGPIILKREKWVALPGDYHELQARIWINHPVGLVSQVKYGMPEESKAALCKIVLEHNGWCDWEGNPYPPAAEPAFWDIIPDEIASILIALVEREKDELPNLVRTMRRR